MSPYIPYPIVAGPTASGKTALAIALAKHIGGEVVSADSMQIYDTVAVGTARPDEEEMCGVVHHLMGFLPLGREMVLAVKALLPLPSVVISTRSSMFTST